MQNSFYGLSLSGAASTNFKGSLVLALITPAQGE